MIQKDGMFRDLCRQSGEDTQLMEVSDIWAVAQDMSLTDRWQN